MQSRVAVAALKSFTETRRFRRNEDGQDLLEYGLLMALIAIIALGAVSTVGNDDQHRVLDGDCQQCLASRSRRIAAGRARRDNRRHHARAAFRTS